MLRQVDLKAISDGRLYSSNDMVRADCGGCDGCSACCQDMGSSIVLDPMDVFCLTKNLCISFEVLCQDKLELNVADGLILPNLKMRPLDHSCPFLNEQKRCSIHEFRPGFCRMFPLGRFYENGSFQYFLQIHECRNTSRGKVKVRKWINVADFKAYEVFVQDWHDYLKSLQEQNLNRDLEEQKAVSMNVLKRFYLLPYENGRDFYQQYYERRNLKV